ncbi:hypothetical protein DITRI_Ditri01bG0157300 [Diplodiscus trichospermus]
MKTLFLLVCILLASSLSIPTPTLARELAGPIYYKPLKPRPPLARNCGIYGRYSRKCRRSPPPPVPPPPAP